MMSFAWLRCIVPTGAVVVLFVSLNARPVVALPVQRDDAPLAASAAAAASERESDVLVGVGQVVNGVLLALGATAMVAEAGQSGYVTATPLGMGAAIGGSLLIDAASLVYSAARYERFSARRELSALGGVGFHDYDLTSFRPPNEPTWRTPGFGVVGFEYRMQMDERWGAFFGFGYGTMQENEVNATSFTQRLYLHQEGGLYARFRHRISSTLEMRTTLLGSARMSGQHFNCGFESSCADSPATRIPNHDVGYEIRNHFAYRFGGGVGADLFWRQRLFVGGRLQAQVGPHSNLTGRSTIVLLSGQAEARLEAGVSF